MNRLPIEKDDFPELIEAGMIYVDKTAYIWDLLSGGKYYFLARPARFGKSLLLSTMKALFEGREPLFRGLFIHEKIRIWHRHPVLLLDFSILHYHAGTNGLENALYDQVEKVALDFGVHIEADSFSDYFSGIIRALCERVGPVAILVDEADRPLFRTLDAPGIFAENLAWLQGFYALLERLDPYLRIVLLTSVTGYGKAPVFSGLRRLEDLTLSPAFNGVCGIEEDELNRFFSVPLQALSQTLGRTPDQLLNRIRRWYGGYSWDGYYAVFNPYSVLELLRRGEFDHYWFEAGNPQGIINWIKRQKHLPSEFENVRVTDPSTGSMTPEHIPVYPLLFQGGYLTISDMEHYSTPFYYVLNYPNLEVRFSFLNYLLAAFMETGKWVVRQRGRALRQALAEGRFAEFADGLRSLYLLSPTRKHLPEAAFFHSLAHLILGLIGVRIQTDIGHTMDLANIKGTLDFPDRIYLIEWNLAVHARIRNVKTLSWNAIRQLEASGIAEQYRDERKKRILLGIGYLEQEVDVQYRYLA